MNNIQQVTKKASGTALEDKVFLKVFMNLNTIKQNELRIRRSLFKSLQFLVRLLILQISFSSEALHLRPCWELAEY